MPKRLLLISVSIIATALSGCSLLPFTETVNDRSRLCANSDGSFDTCKPMSIQQESDAYSLQDDTAINGLHVNMLGEYTEQMAVDIQRDVYGLQVDEPIVVASFVHLDASLRNADTLGIQLAESFINELQQIGLPVSDHKLMVELDVNAKGDFAFSRDMDFLKYDADVGYVLAGTLLKNSRGVLVNARLIHSATNVVVASSSKLIPNLLIQDML